VAGKVKSYVGAVEYDAAGGVARIGTEEGYILKRTGWNENSKDSKFVYYYSVKDHLGNVRLVLDDESNAKLWQRNDYHAFGMHINQPVDGVPLPDLIGINDRYYNGKEYDDQTTWLDYGARQYDYSLGSWMAVDPMAEKGRKWSPYVYAFDNPMRFIDPDGMFANSFEKPGDKFKTKIEAANDFAHYYNGTSIAKNKEFGSAIYKSNDGTYSYTVAYIGSNIKTEINENIPNNSSREGAIHTHGAEDPGLRSEKFSTDDKEAAEIMNQNEYVVTPSGKLKEYDVETNKQIIPEGASKNIPSDNDSGKKRVNKVEAKDTKPVYINPKTNTTYNEEKK
jgi:RHS repeat-associated protein